MIATVRATRAARGMACSCAKASRRSELMGTPAETGADYKCMPRRRRVARRGRRVGSAGVEVRQAADQPPALGDRVVPPPLVVGEGALDLGVAVDQADLDDLLEGQPVRGHAAAELVVAGHLHLAEALALQVAER